MRLIVCNTNWACGKKKELLNEIIFGMNPDIVCATEIRKDFFQKAGNIIFSEDNYGYNTINRYKVSLWSKAPWKNYAPILSNAPSGRFVFGETIIDSKKFSFAGVCIPWKSAHVSTGKKNKKIWEDHISYLNALKEKVSSSDEIDIICGDMNQRIPETIQPDNVYKLLLDTFEKYNIITKGNINKLEQPVIDHIAIKNVETKDVFGISRIQNNIELTDHDIVVADFE